MISFLFAFICVVASHTVFDGKWELDGVHKVGSSDDVLRLIGIDQLKIDLLNSIQVTEVYRIDEKQFYQSRRTSFGINSDDVFPLGVTQDVTDIILGKVKQTVTYSDRKLQSTLVRQSDKAVFIGTKKINRDDENRIIYSMNFTLPNGKKAACVRYLLKRPL